MIPFWNLGENAAGLPAIPVGDNSKDELEARTEKTGSQEAVAVEAAAVWPWGRRGEQGRQRARSPGSGGSGAGTAGAWQPLG